MAHFVYILYSKKHDRYYVGESANVELRLKFHNELSTTSYTAKFRPWKLVLVMEATIYATARKVERHIKRQPTSQGVQIPR